MKSAQSKTSWLAVLAGLVVLVALVVGFGLRENRDPDRTVARVGDKNIPGWMFDNAFNDRMKSEKDADAAAKRRIRAEIMDNLVTMELLSAEAEKQGIEVGDAAAYLRVAVVEGSYGDKEVFERTLEDAGLTREMYADLWRQQIMVNRLVDEKIKPSVTVEEDEITALYEEEKERFGDAPPEAVRPELEEVILDAKVHVAMDEYVAELKKQNKIEIFDD